MKTLEPKRAENKAEKAAVNGSAEDATVSAPSVQIDLSKVKIEPLFADDVDFETFSKSDFRVVKIEACEAVPKSEDSRQPQCPPEKEKAILVAFKYFGMI